MPDRGPASSVQYQLRRIADLRIDAPPSIRQWVALYRKKNVTTKIKS
jgi:hypothetical protein